MPLESMRTYLANSQGGREGARRQMELLDAQALRLAAKAESIRMQQAYVSFKTLYWRAKAEGRDEEAQQLIEEKPEHHRTGEAPANRRQTINDNRQIFPTKE